MSSENAAARRLEHTAGSKIGPERCPRAIHKLMLCSSCVMFFSDTFPLSCKTGCRSDLDSPLRARNQHFLRGTSTKHHRAVRFSHNVAFEPPGLRVQSLLKTLTSWHARLGVLKEIC